MLKYEDNLYLGVGGVTVIGLTGNIGSGKTTVCKIMEQEWGWCCLNADNVGRLVVEPDGEAYEELLGCFGGEYFLPDGRLNRPKLAELVFHDKAALARLNEITHPAVKRYLRREIERILQENPEQIVVVEAALLVEAEYLDLLDELWLVWADDEVRLGRVMARDGLTVEQAKSRMDNQMPQEVKAKYARRIVHNNSDEEYLRSCLARVRQEFAE